MFTAEQIAEQTNIPVYTVRYRLSELKRKGLIEGEKYGTTYVYRASVICKVKNFDKKKG